MAEQLGQAVLELTVDTKALEKGLDDARKKIAALTSDVSLGIKTQGADAPQQALKNISTQAERASARVQTLNQVLNQIPGNSYAKLSASISKLTSESLDLQLTSEQYLKTLTRIRELEGIRQLKVGRQQALAGEAAYSPSGALGQLNQAQLPQLPLTLEGQAQNIRELQQRLRNLNYESAEYAETLRVLQNAQRQYDQALSGTSDIYRQLAQQEEAAIRRAEKLRGIQEYYADKNPRAGGIRDGNGNMLARGANSAADERAYNAALRPSQTLLENDLQRVQALRQVTQRLQEQLALIDQIRGKQGNGGFGEASASNFGTTDPVQKSIRRNEEKRAKEQERQQAQQERLDADLTRQRERRLKAEKATAEAAQAIEKAQKKAAQQAERAAETRKQRNKDIIANAVIGGAFPLLFGQGIGASIGGGAGGALGGLAGGQFGFGLSLVGTALGQAFDTALEKAKTLAKGLDDPISSFSALQEAALFSSKSVEKNVAALIEAGRAEEAAILARRDLNKQFGSAEGAQELINATDELNRAWAQASISLASFVAGPLSTFLKAISAGLGGGPTQLAIQDNKRANEIINSSPEARQQFLDLAKQRGVKLNSDLKVSSEDIGKRVALVEAFLKARGELTTAQKEDLSISNELTDASARRNAIEKATLGILEAQASGDRLGAFEKQEQLIRNLRDSQLAALSASATQIQRDSIRKKASEDLKKLEIERGTFERQLFADRVASANRILDIESQISIARERSAGSLSGAGVGALQTAAGFEAAKRREQDAQALLRVRPDDTGLQNSAREAAKQTELAAANARADLIEASKSAEESVKNIAQSLQDAVLAQQQLVGTNQGLTGILGGQAAVNRQKEVNAQLQQQARQVKEEFIKSLGPNADPAVVNAVNRKEFGGSLSQQNSQLIQFIDAARQELRGSQGIGNLQEQLVTAQNDLVTINTKLAEVNEQVTQAVNNLVEKNWVVNVNVPGGSASGDVVGAINSRP